MHAVTPAELDERGAGVVLRRTETIRASVKRDFRKTVRFGLAAGEPTVSGGPDSRRGVKRRRSVIDQLGLFSGIIAWSSSQTP
jgi:hypothetical protein